MAENSSQVNRGTPPTEFHSAFQGEISSEMEDYFKSPLDSKLFSKAIDSFVRLSKDDFVRLFLSKFKTYADSNSLNNQKQNQVIRDLKIELGKQLMTSLGYKSQWFFGSKNKLEHLAGDIFALAHAIRNKKLEPDVFEFFVMKGEGSKVCEVCENMKVTLDEHTSLLKQLKWSNDQLTGMVNSILNSNHMKSFEFSSLNTQVGEKTLEETRKRQRCDEIEGSSSSRFRASSESASRSADGQVSATPQWLGTNPGYSRALASLPSSGSVLASVPKPLSNFASKQPSRRPGQESQPERQAKAKNGGSSRPPTAVRQGGTGNEETRKKKHIYKNLVIGTNVNNGVIKRAARNYHYSVGRFESEVDANKIKNFLTGKINGEFSVEKIDLTHDKFRIFRISCFDTNNAVMIDPDTWPQGIEVKRYFFPRSHQKKTDAPALPASSILNPLVNDVAAKSVSSNSMSSEGIMEST